MSKNILKIVSLVLALVLCILCVTVTAATNTPKVVLFGNESTPAKPGETIKLYARLTGLSDMAGLDISVTGGTDFAFTGINADNFTLTQGTNYTLTSTKIHIVDLFNLDGKVKLAGIFLEIDAKIADNAQAGVYSVTFTGIIAGNDGKTKLSEGTLATATVVVREKEKEAQAGTLTATEGMFIPYGSVYDANNEYIDKEIDGEFNVADGDKYTQYKIGESGITTFGTSYANDDTAVQFGSYANGKSDKTFGTMCILGDWEGFKSYYRSQKGYSESTLIKLISDRYDTLIYENPEATHVIMKCNNKTVEIHIYKVEQTKYMWGKEHSTDLQYALRVLEIEQGEQYAAVGYYIKSGETVLSTEIQTVEVE